MYRIAWACCATTIAWRWFWIYRGCWKLFPGPRFEFEIDGVTPSSSGSSARSSLEEVMKSRLSGTILTLIVLNAIAYAAAIYFAFSAGKQAAGGSSETTGVFVAGGVALIASILLFWRLS